MSDTKSSDKARLAKMYLDSYEKFRAQIKDPDERQSFSRMWVPRAHQRVEEAVARRERMEEAFRKLDQAQADAKPAAEKGSDKKKTKKKTKKKRKKKGVKRRGLSIGKGY
jgi:hypothetical protein